MSAPRRAAPARPRAGRGAPVFVVGANRSGTTLLRLMLDAHPAFAVPDELAYFGPSMAGLAPEAWRAAPSPGAYAAFVRGWLRRAGPALAGWLEADRAALVDRLLADPDRDLRRPYAAALEAYAAARGAARWGEKTPLNLFYADVLIGMFPDARFVHVVRDPRSGVQSMLAMGGFGAGPVWCALNRRRYVVEGGAWLARHVPEAQRATVRYEDLVAAPEAEARRLCAFLGEPFDPAMLAFHRGAYERMVPEAAGGFNALATRPVSAARAEAWRDEMAPAAQARVDAVSGPVLAAHGYAPSAHRLGLADRLAVGAAWAYWRLEAWRNRHVRGYILRHVPLARTRARLRRALGAPAAP